MSNRGFIDYYEDLQVSANAEKETIDNVFRFLARRWHPDNKSTGDPDKFNSIKIAHKNLSDPKIRADYDVEYEENKSSRWELPPKFSSINKGENDKDVRLSILSILYIIRRKDPESGALGMWRIAKMLRCEEEKDIAFHIWYLKEKNLIQRTDSGGVAITINGVEFVEKMEHKIEAQKLICAGQEIPEDETRLGNG